MKETGWKAISGRRGFGGLFFRLYAIGETIFVLLALVIIARIVSRALGFDDADSFLFGEGVEPDFLGAAAAEGRWHAVRYGLIFLAITAIGLIRRRRDPASYGLSFGGLPLWRLIGLGIGAFAVMHIPSLALRFADRVFDIGPGTPFWTLMGEVEWNRDFWIFMAVSSFAVVPLVEEFVARGYLLGRLREDFSAGAALLLMGLLFAAAHTQYHQTDLYSLGSLATLVWGSVIMGYTVLRTGSLVPAIVAHALVNVPTSHYADYTVVAVIAIILFVFRRAYAENARRFIGIFGAVNDWASAFVVGGFIVAFGATLQATPWSPYAWLAGFSLFFIASLFVKSVWKGRKREGA